MRALVIIASTILVAAIIVSSRPAAASQPACGDGENETPCPAAYAWQTGDWSDWSGECDTVTRERPVWCSDADDPNSYWPDENCASEKPASVESEERWRCPIYEWTTTEWGDWSASCGEATRTRTAQCVDAADGNSERDASVCESAGIPAPELVETYTFEACAPAVWRYGEWGEWSATCGDVRRERPVWCVDATESTVDDAQCVAEDRPASEEYTSLNVCERYEWRIGGWGDWSGSCGTVTRTREVQCVDAADGGSERDAWRCELATGYTPESSEDGDLGSCVAPEWRTNEWGAWSATCTDANGADVTHSRTVWCENAFDGSLLGDDACDANARPWSEETAADAGYELPPCHHCALGQYAPPSRPTSCVACSVGRYSDTTTASACTRCAVGRFAATSGAVECTVCARGKYAPTVGRSACQTCAAGRYSDTEGASVCSSCAVGTASSIAGAETSEVCTACSPGFYAAIEGSRRCTACPSGWYTSEPGAAECSPCAVGSAASSAGSSSCKTCSRGRFAPELAASACQRCAIGRYASAEGGESCTACAPGHYAATEGRSSCSGCARGAFSAASGASTCTLCAPGTFLATSRGSSCNLCPVGRFAAAAGATACDVCASAGAPGASTCDR